MKSYLSYIVVFLSVAGLIFFTGCPDDDTTPPYIYFENQDTTVLMYKKLTDPGIMVEDNKNFASEIKVESDFYDEVSINNDSLAWRTGEFEVAYTATDAAGNSNEKISNVVVKNPSEIIANAYNVDGNYDNIKDTNFVSIISPHNRFAGTVRFSKVYVHRVDGELLYLKVLGNLYSPNHSTDITDPTVEPDENIKWMGTPNNPSEPFYKDMYYTETMKKMDRYKYIHIPNQTYEDTVFQENHIIRGKKDTDTGLPKSTIKYSNDGSIEKLTLVITVDTEGLPTEVVRETYTVRL